MKKIRLGVIGTGLAWERLHYPAIQELGDKYEIAALANRTRKDAEGFANRIGLDLKDVYDDYKEMLKRTDLDAIDILVPIQLNYQVSRDAAEAGFDFICEKPLAPDMSQARKYLDLENNYGVKILIAENYRYNEETMRIKELVDSGRLGKLAFFIKTNVSCFPCEMTKDTFAATEWRQHPRFKGGAFLDAALHDIAAMRYIFGNVECVQAFGIPQKEDFNPYLSVNANVQFKNGIIGQYTYFPSGVETLKPPIGLRIFGTNGEIYMEEKTSGSINVTYSDGKSEQVSFTPERGFYNELLNFYNALNGIEEIKVTPEVEYGDTKMVFDILKSIELRKAIYVDEPQIDVYSNNIEETPILDTYMQPWQTWQQ